MQRFLAGVNLYSVEFSVSCSCSVAVCSPDVHYCAPFRHVSSSVRVRFWDAERETSERMYLSPTTSILILWRGRVLNGRRIESDGAEKKRRAETEVHTFDVTESVVCKCMCACVCPRNTRHNVSYVWFGVIVVAQLALFHGYEYLVSGMQIYRGSRISLAYISCFRVSYRESRI